MFGGNEKCGGKETNLYFSKQLFTARSSRRKRQNVRCWYQSGVLFNLNQVKLDYAQNNLFVYIERIKLLHRIQNAVKVTGSILTDICNTLKMFHIHYCSIQITCMNDK